jgi:hypothetical protein
MDLPREFTRTLRSNESARLRCHKSWANEKGCVGLEASMLEKL